MHKKYDAAEKSMIFGETKKDKLQERVAVLTDCIRDNGLAVERLQKQDEAETKDLYEQYHNIKKQIDAIEEKYSKQKAPIEKKKDEQENELRTIKTVLQYYQAQATLNAGITTKEQFLRYIYLSGHTRKMDTNDIREWKHTRGKDIHVWAFKFDWKEKVAYFATTKDGKLLASLTVEKASHPGDTMYSTSYGCKKVKDFDKKTKYHSYAREGICMKEWIDGNLVKWIGLEDADQIVLWNEITY